MVIENLSEIIRIDILLGVGGLLVGMMLLSRRRKIPKGLKLPPGPRGKPIVGNRADMPTHHGWETYTKWAKEFGDLVHIKVFSQSMVFVNSMDVARELFDRRSSLYSDRFQSAMLSDLMGLDWSLARMRYGQRWRQHRRTFHQHFHPNASMTYRDIHIKHTLDMLRNLLKSPKDFTTHIRHHAGAIILEVVYGIEVLPIGDPYIEIAEKALAATAEAGNAGTFLVDILPILKYVPEWMPGAGFKGKARVWRKSITEMVEMPFMMVKQALDAGTVRPSMTASLLEDLYNQKDPQQGQEEVIRNSGAVAYGAGSDTIVSAMSSFVLAMVLYPETQRNAQAELYRVVGTGRLPTFEDRESLPYINALCNEVLRWHPVVPLAIAHRVTQDDVYGCYFIPSGSIIFGNTWAILQNEKIYGSHPEEFRPERFLNKGTPEPTAAFGFGRRICPGRHLANDSLFIAVASILHVFDISHARDSSGNEIHVNESFTSGMISHPEPFQCSIKPRSVAAGDVIWARTDN